VEKSEREAGRIELNLYILFNFIVFVFNLQSVQI